MRFDFHCHSHCSDGALSPQELIDLAFDQNLEALAITDHDSVEAYRSVPPGEYSSAEDTSKKLWLVAGCEFSALWSGKSIHVVGLDFDLDSTPLLALLDRARNARQQRAERIADELAKLGIMGALKGAEAYVQSDAGVIGRPHFARFLVDSGIVSNQKKAFKKFLGSGKPGDINIGWPSLREVVEVVADAGGVSIIAHPIHYNFTRTKLIRLVDEFCEMGGQGLEVISGKQPPNQVQQLTEIANQRNMLSSKGSDFHQLGQPWASLGQLAALSESSRPVWRECAFSLQKQVTQNGDPEH